MPSRGVTFAPFELCYINQGDGMTKKKEDQLTIFNAGLVADVLGHGGKREGAGRPANKPTIPLRVDMDLKPVLSELNRIYRSCDDDQKQSMLSLMNTLLSAINK